MHEHQSEWVAGVVIYTGARSSYILIRSWCTLVIKVWTWVTIIAPVDNSQLAVRAPLARFAGNGFWDVIWLHVVVSKRECSVWLHRASLIIVDGIIDGLKLMWG